LTALRSGEPNQRSGFKPGGVWAVFTPHGKPPRIFQEYAKASAHNLAFGIGDDDRLYLAHGRRETERRIRKGNTP
jgi:hypothetical protein